MARVYVGYDDYGLEGVDLELIQFIFDVVISMTALDGESEVGMILATDEHIRKLNKNYRGKDQSTNVLSFSSLEVGVGDPMPQDTGNYLGDIYISRNLVEREAKKLGVAPKQEFARLFVHGLLHLAGMDHDKAAATKKMEALEDKILSQIE